MLTDKNVQCIYSVFPNLRKPKVIDFKSIFMQYLLIRSTVNFNSTIKILSSGHFFQERLNLNSYADIVGVQDCCLIFEMQHYF